MTLFHHMTHFPSYCLTHIHMHYIDWPQSTPLLWLLNQQFRFTHNDEGRNIISFSSVLREAEEKRNMANQPNKEIIGSGLLGLDGRIYISVRVAVCSVSACVCLWEKGIKEGLQGGRGLLSTTNEGVRQLVRFNGRSAGIGAAGSKPAVAVMAAAAGVVGVAAAAAEQGAFHAS